MRKVEIGEKGMEERGVERGVEGIVKEGRKGNGTYTCTCTYAYNKCERVSTFNLHV